MAMIRPFLLFVAAGLLLGCGGAEIDEPATELQATSTAKTTAPKPLVVPTGDGLREMIDRTLDYTQHGREMSLEDHAAWQLLQCH